MPLVLTGCSSAVVRCSTSAIDCATDAETDSAYSILPRQHDTTQQPVPQQTSDSWHVAQQEATSADAENGSGALLHGFSDASEEQQEENLSPAPHLDEGGVSHQMPTAADSSVETRLATPEQKQQASKHALLVSAQQPC